MEIKELLEKVQREYDKNPNANVAIWIWENYAKSPNYSSCVAEDAKVVEIFNGDFVISCDKKGSSEKKEKGKVPRIRHQYN
jgi:hypothetical protein